MFIRNAWYVATLGRRNFRPDRWRDASVNEPVVLCGDATGKAAALIDMCCHRGAPLRTWGKWSSKASEG